ncbi:MAG: Gfo/Idh/MocA family oxidoreductase, partial [Enterococcus gilvus]|nr:Gfo/Idh/MocA family oxidoreductase [Enterococcus gilvus]
MTELQWGIVGLGDIAHDFAENFNQTTSSLTACASRTLEKAEKFAKEYGIAKAYGSYQEMLADEAISIIYIAVPNRQHHQHIIQALEAGKHVLCEKAITMTLAELQEAIALAEKNQLILAEAMTIFNMPLYQELHTLMDSGK